MRNSILALLIIFISRFNTIIPDTIHEEVYSPGPDKRSRLNLVIFRPNTRIFAQSWFQSLTQLDRAECRQFEPATSYLSIILASKRMFYRRFIFNCIYFRKMHGMGVHGFEPVNDKCNGSSAIINGKLFDTS